MQIGPRLNNLEIILNAIASSNLLENTQLFSFWDPTEETYSKRFAGFSYLFELFHILGIFFSFAIIFFGSFKLGTKIRNFSLFVPLNFWKITQENNCQIQLHLIS